MASSDRDQDPSPAYGSGEDDGGVDQPETLVQPDATQSGGSDRSGASDRFGAGDAEGIADRIIDAAFSLAETRGWSRMALADVAAEAGLGLLDVYRAMPSKLAILIAFGRRLDRQVLAGIVDEPEESPRDRLFDVLMRRFDAALPFREGVRAIARDLRRDPLTALAGGPHFLHSMGWMLEAAGIPMHGISGIVRVNALARLYLSVQRTFLDDDTPDLSRTMAALDQKLRRSTRMLGLAGRGSFSAGRGREDTEDAPERSYSSAYAWDATPDPETAE